MEDIIGTEVMSDKTTSQPVGEAMTNIKFVGLYFGAHWAPCCRRFTTTLTEKYNEINANSKEFEVIFVSKDGNQAAFDRNFDEMPWKAIKYEDEARKKSLEQRYGIMEIPTLIILAPDGSQVSDAGIRDLQGTSANAIVEAWEKMQEANSADAAGANAVAAQ